MAGKAGHGGSGNAAEKLKLTRAMPVFPAVMPLPEEGAPAVAAVSAPKRGALRRAYRISTYLSDEAGARLNRLVAHFKATHGRRCGAPDVLERALVALERELGLG